MDCLNNIFGYERIFVAVVLSCANCNIVLLCDPMGRFAGASNVLFLEINKMNSSA